MNEQQSDYLSYLLRLWQVGEEGRADGVAEKRVWRASLEHPTPTQRRGFACLDDLFDFLRQQIGQG